jgi:hypothetical protein
MHDLDLSWLGFGLFLLACGLVPAALAWRDARREAAPPATRLFHESARMPSLPRLSWTATGPRVSPRS